MKHKNNIAEYRKATGKTQKQLATDVEVSEISIQNIEAGKHEPKISLAKRISKALNKSVEEVFPDNETTIFKKIAAANTGMLETAQRKLR